MERGNPFLIHLHAASVIDLLTQFEVIVRVNFAAEGFECVYKWRRWTTGRNRAHKFDPRSPS